jgi:hypothetical protein
VDQAGGVIIILLVAAIAIPLSVRLIEDIVRRRVVVRSIGMETTIDEQRNGTISRVLRTTAKVGSPSSISCRERGNEPGHSA